MIPNDKLCTVCHQTGKSEGRVILGEVKGADACFTCHKHGDIDKVHVAPAGPTEKPPVKLTGKPVAGPAETCQTCHTMHGSARRALLKPSAK